MSDLSVHEVLVRARNLYAKAPSHAPHGRVPQDGICVVMACDRSGGWNWQERKPELVLAGAAGLEPDGDGDFREPLIRWNADATTAEALAAFDKAIAETAPVPDVSFIKEEATVNA